MDIGAVEKAILTDCACDCFIEGTLDALVDNDAEADETGEDCDGRYMAHSRRLSLSDPP